MDIHHIGYLVKRLESAICEFELLGYSVEQSPINDATRGVNICFMSKNAYHIELICPTDKTSPIYGLMSKYKNSPYHICYSSYKFEEDMENLQQQGFMIFQKPAKAPALDNSKVVFMISSEIGIIELVEMKNQEQL